MSPAVRNIRGIGGVKPIPVYVWIPPKFSPIHKIEIFDGITATDVTDIVIEGEYIDGVTETIGSFSFQIDNSNETYTNLFNTYDQIRIYLDYGATASTRRFIGLIERISKKEHTLVITGRGTAAKFSGKNVTYAATDTARSTILSEIIAKYFSADLTTNNLETDSGLATVSYSDKPWQEVIEEICQAGGRDSYTDKDSDFHYFESGSRLNITEAVVHESNLISVGDFSPDASNIFNKIKVYGLEVGGFPLIATASDSASQTTYGVKELKIDDKNITTVSQAQARADYELSLQKDPPTVGEVTSLGLPTILPGEMIRISDPQNGLNPNYYAIQKFIHKFSNDSPMMTILTIKKERSTIPNILKKRIKFETDITISNNPNEHDFSEIYDFNSDTGTHSNTEIEINSVTGKGVLKTDGASTGTWTSPTLNLSSNLSGSSDIKFEGTDISSVQVHISTDGGTIFTPLPAVSIPSGRRIKIKMILNSANTRIDTLAILYNKA